MVDDVHYSSNDDGWQTPEEVIEAVIQAMGRIDLDPCSNSNGPPNIPAQTHYTEREDGLAQRWRGHIYMNPPYGREIKNWVEKLAAEFECGRVEQAIALVPARVDTAWWRRLIENASAVCFIRGRLRFRGAKNGAPFPSAVVALGLSPGQLHRALGDMGEIYTLWKTV